MNPVEERVKAAREALRRAIAESGISQREVERRAGLKEKYLQGVFLGRTELRAEHIYLVLEHIEMEPSRFFASLHPQQGSPPPSSGYLLVPAPPAPDFAAELDQLEQRLGSRMEEQIRSSLQSALERFGATPPDPEAKESAKERKKTGG